MRQRARISVYWPHMDVDIANAVATCEDRISLLPFLPAEPLLSNEPATRPFDFLHADLGGDDGRYFLVIVDQFSSWSHVVVFFRQEHLCPPPHRRISTILYGLED